MLFIFELLLHVYFVFSLCVAYYTSTGMGLQSSASSSLDSVLILAFWEGYSIENVLISVNMSQTGDFTQTRAQFPGKA